MLEPMFQAPADTCFGTEVRASGDAATNCRTHVTERTEAARLSCGGGPVLVEGGRARVCRETVVCRRSTSEPHSMLRSVV